jgi:repressor LexA
VSIQGEVARAEIVTAIKLYYEKHGFSPSIREISDMTGIKSTSTIHRHLDIIESRGIISRFKNSPRIIKLMKEA